MFCPHGLNFSYAFTASFCCVGPLQTFYLIHSFIQSWKLLIYIGPVQTSNFSCTDPNPFSFKSTWKKTFESAKSDMSNLGWPMIKIEYPTWEVRELDYGASSFQTSIFSSAKFNA